jgi:hypothetical protein
MVSAGLFVPLLLIIALLRSSAMTNLGHLLLLLLLLASPLLASGADVSQPLIILVVAIALAGIAILILFAKDRI